LLHTNNMSFPLSCSASAYPAGFPSPAAFFSSSQLASDLYSSPIKLSSNKVSAHSFIFYLPDIVYKISAATHNDSRKALLAPAPGSMTLGYRMKCARSRAPFALSAWRMDGRRLRRSLPRRGPALPPGPSPHSTQPCSSMVNSQAHQNSSGCASGGQATQRVLIRGSTADAKWLYSSIPVVLQG